MVYNKNEYDANYKKEHYNNLQIYLPKGSKQFLKDYANGNGITVSKLVTNAIESYLKNNGGNLS